MVWPREPGTACKPSPCPRRDNPCGYNQQGDGIGFGDNQFATRNLQLPALIHGAQNCPEFHPGFLELVLLGLELVRGQVRSDPEVRVSDRFAQ